MEFIKKLSTYTIFTLVERSINFILLPVLTHYLVPEEFGKVALFQTFVLVMQPLVLLNMNGAIMIEFFSRSKKEFSKLISNILSVILLASLVVLTIAVCFYEPLFSSFSFPVTITMIALCFTESVKTILMALLQCQKKARQFGLYSITATLLNIVITIILFNVLPPSGLLRIYGIFIASFIAAIICIVYLIANRLITFSVSKKEISKLIKFGSPLIIHSYVFIVVSSADRFFIKKYYGDAILGIYATAAAVNTINNAIYSSVNNAWLPFLYEYLKEGVPEAMAKINSFTKKLLYLLLGLLGLYIVGCFVLYYFIINPKYFKSLYISIILGIGFFSSFFYNINANILFFYKKTAVFFKVGLIVIAFNVILNYFFITSFSIIGAAIVYGLTYMCFAFLIYLNAKPLFTYKLFG